jgi:hypothetical protein
MMRLFVGDDWAEDALDSGYAAARAQRRRDARPVTADEESFTAAWRHAVFAPGFY